MVLDSIGAGLLNQDDLYSDNHAHSTAESGWYSAPDGVLWTMNALKPPSPTFNSYFVLDALDHEDSISRCIVWTIHHYKVAPIAMVYGSQHWLVVRGYTASAAPRGRATRVVAQVPGYGPHTDERRLRVVLENVRRFVAGRSLVNVADKARWL